MFLHLERRASEKETLEYKVQNRTEQSGERERERERERETSKWKEKREKARASEFTRYNSLVTSYTLYFESHVLEHSIR